jgi:hypothetical protein
MNTELAPTPETSEAWAAVSRLPDGMYDSSVPITAYADATLKHSKKMERERDAVAQEAGRSLAEIMDERDAAIAALEATRRYSQSASDACHQCLVHPLPNRQPTPI